MNKYGEIRMEKLLAKPTEAADAIGVGRSKIYELIASGTVPSVRIGRSVRVPVEALRKWVEEQVSINSADADQSTSSSNV